MATAKKLPSGNYRILIYTGTVNGKRKYKSFTAPTKKDAERLAVLWEESKVSIRIADYTLEEAIKAYCDLKSNVLSPSTIREYRRTADKYDFLSTTKIKDIDSDCVQRWVNDFAKDHAPKTVKSRYGIISAVMDAYAPDTRLKVTLPQKVRPQLYIPSDKDIQTIIKYFIDSGDNDMEIAIYLAAYGTLRRSEICALTADDVNGNVIYINKAMVDAGKSEWVIKTTKTLGSTRFVDMPDFVIQKLPTSGNLVNINPNTITHRMEMMFKELDIQKFRFHDLRHYSASIMHAIGVPDVYIMQRGGWSSDATLKNIYRGSIEDYMKKYNGMTIQHFDNMQHKMQHENEKPQ